MESQTSAIPKLQDIKDQTYKITSLVEIGTECTSNCEFNYHTITTLLP